jgi:hypothetical protein
MVRGVNLWPIKKKEAHVTKEHLASKEQRAYGAHGKDEEERGREGQRQLGTGRKGWGSIGGCWMWTRRAKAGLRSKRNHFAQDANSHEGYKRGEIRKPSLPPRCDAALGQVGLTSGTLSHRGTSRYGAQSACKVSAHAVLGRRVV